MGRSVTHFAPYCTRIGAQYGIRCLLKYMYTNRYTDCVEYNNYINVHWEAIWTPFLTHPPSPSKMDNIITANIHYVGACVIDTRQSPPPPIGM